MESKQEEKIKCSNNRCGYEETEDLFINVYCRGHLVEYKCPSCGTVSEARSTLMQDEGYKPPYTGEPAKLNDMRKVKRAIERRLKEKGIDDIELVGSITDICMKYGERIKHERDTARSELQRMKQKSKAEKSR